MLSSLESQNDSEVEGISAKVKMLKNVCPPFHPPSAIQFGLVAVADLERSPWPSATKSGILRTSLTSTIALTIPVFGSGAI